MQISDKLDLRMKKLFLTVLLMPIAVFAQDDFSLTEKVQSLLGFTMPTISADELNAMQTPILLDARELKEFEVSHIPSAKYVGYQDFSLSKVSDFAKTDTIVVYCTVGYRSEKIAEQLSKAGYQNVYNLFGGIFSWKNNSYSVVDIENQKTQRVHCYNKKWSILLLNGEKVY